MEIAIDWHGLNVTATYTYAEATHDDPGEDCIDDIDIEDELPKEFKEWILDCFGSEIEEALRKEV